MTEGIQSVFAGKKGGNYKWVVHKGTSGGDRYVPYLDYAVHIL